MRAAIHCGGEAIQDNSIEVRMNIRISITRFLVLAMALLAFATPSTAQGQGATITGRVTADDGRPVTTANVYINDLQISVPVTATGAYTITIPQARLSGGSVNLRVRAIGYTPELRAITLTMMSVLLTFAIALLIEGLLGYAFTGTQRRIQLGYGSASLEVLGHWCNMHAAAVQKWRAGMTPHAAELTQLRLMATEFGFTPASVLEREWFGNTNCEGDNGRATL